MKKLLLGFTLIFLLLTASAQHKIRPVDELVNKSESAWQLVKQWIDSAKNKVEILPVDTGRATEALFKTQVTTRSPMGSIIYSTGGLLIDDGWIRILGSGSSKLSRTLPDWNQGKSFNEVGDKPPFLLVADDALGGFFAINGGQFGAELGKLYYLAPDDLEWEPLGMTYTSFLQFCFNGDLEAFYRDFRWTNWRSDVSKLGGGQAYQFYPFLWTVEGKDINNMSKKILSIDEQYRFELDMRKQLGLEK